MNAADDRGVLFDVAFAKIHFQGVNRTQRIHLQAAQSYEIATAGSFFQVATGNVEHKIVAWRHDLENLQAKVPATHNQYFFLFHEYLPIDRLKLTKAQGILAANADKRRYLQR